MSSRKISTYILYAVGEIVLVVIGILIAVQIDNWNQENKNRRNEQLLLQNLQNEFLNNDSMLDTVLQRHNGIQNTISLVMGLINTSVEELRKHNIDSLLYIAIDYRDYNPGGSVISELISSGKMELIKSEKIRTLIYSWQSALDEKNENWDSLDEFSQTLVMPYLIKNASLKNIDYYGLGRPNGKSKFATGNHHLFSQLELENNMDNYYWSVTNYLDNLEKLKTIIKEILKETDDQLTKMN